MRRCSYRFLLAAVAVLSAAGCSTPTPPPTAVVVSIDAETTSINAVLDGWHRAAAEADEEAYFGAMTEDAVFLGTDATERWDKAAFQAYAHPHFARGKAWSFSATRRDVILSQDGRLAWFDEDLDTPNLGPCRGSGVLRKEKGGWRIAHYNLTLTIPNDALGSVKEALAQATAEPPRGISGVVQLVGTPPEMRVPKSRKDAFACKDKLLPHNAVRVKDGKLADVLVALVDSPLSEPEEADAPARLTFRDCQLAPRILPLLSEQTLELDNDDAVMHNFNGRQAGEMLFNVALPKGAPRLKKAFDKPGIVSLRCDVHPWERSYLYISNHHHFAVSDEQGAFALPDVPAGKHQLMAWHSQFARLQQPVTVGHKGVEIGFTFRTDMAPPEESRDELDGLFE